MKANELMIGDWLEVILDNGKYKDYARVANLSDNGAIELAITGEPGAYWSLDGNDDIKPIPLTIEILEKNGFHLMHGFGYSETYPTYGWGDKDGDKYISVDVRFYDDEPIGSVQHLVKINRDSMKEDGVDSIHSCDIDYVHKLQHALRLCGIEKEIVL